MGTITYPTLEKVQILDSKVPLVGDMLVSSGPGGYILDGSLLEYGWDSIGNFFGMHGPCQWFMGKKKTWKTMAFPTPDLLQATKQPAMAKPRVPSLRSNV